MVVFYKNYLKHKILVDTKVQGICACYKQIQNKNSGMLNNLTLAFPDKMQHLELYLVTKMLMCCSYDQHNSNNITITVTKDKLHCKRIEYKYIRDDS